MIWLGHVHTQLPTTPRQVTQVTGLYSETAVARMNGLAGGLLCGVTDLLCPLGLLASKGGLCLLIDQSQLFTEFPMKRH